MKQLSRCVLFSVLSAATHLSGQNTPTTKAPLVQIGAVALPSVRGRIDHFAFDPSGRLFLSALANNTEEIIDLRAQTLVHTISGIPTPQGVAYSPEANKIFVASEKGKLYIFDGTSFERIAAIDFGGDVDNLRYSAAEKRVYVGYGDEGAAGIGVIDVRTNARLEDAIKLSAHPESFQLEESGGAIFVNVPDLRQIVVFDRKTRNTSIWHMPLEDNFPMALDEPDHRLFVATRKPPRLLVLDSASGRTLATLPCVPDSDDLYFDAVHRRVYVAGGGGYISVFKQSDGDHYQLLSDVPTASGARTAGYAGKIGKDGFDRLYVAVPARADRKAEVRIYAVQD